MEVSWAAATHPGMRRDTNEDSYCARPDLGLFVVADGMGGHVAGEVASRLAIEEIAATLGRGPDADATWGFSVDPVIGEDGSRLREAFHRANLRLAAATTENASLRGMATTASAVLVNAAGDASVAHVGDTRIYLVRDGPRRTAHRRSLLGGGTGAGRDAGPAGGGAPPLAQRRHARDFGRRGPARRPPRRATPAGRPPA